MKFMDSIGAVSITTEIKRIVNCYSARVVLHDANGRLTLSHEVLPNRHKAYRYAVSMANAAAKRFGLSRVSN